MKLAAVKYGKQTNFRLLWRSTFVYVRSPNCFFYIHVFRRSIRRILSFEHICINLLHTANDRCCHRTSMLRGSGYSPCSVHSTHGTRCAMYYIIIIIIKTLVLFDGDNKTQWFASLHFRTLNNYRAELLQSFGFKIEIEQHPKLHSIRLLQSFVEHLGCALCTVVPFDRTK